MLSQFTHCAQNLWAHLSSAAYQFLRHLIKPARPNLVTGTLADLPRTRAELLAENALLRQQLIVLLATPFIRANLRREVARDKLRGYRATVGHVLNGLHHDYRWAAA
jgi:hypothetical protein